MRAGLIRPAVVGLVVIGRSGIDLSCDEDTIKQSNEGSAPSKDFSTLADVDQAGRTMAYELGHRLRCLRS